MNKTIHKQNFQHFPFHLIAPTPGLVLISGRFNGIISSRFHVLTSCRFHFFNLHYINITVRPHRMLFSSNYTVRPHRTLFSSNYTRMEKRPLNINEPLNSNKQSPLSNDGCGLTDTNSNSLNKQKGGISAIPKPCNGSGKLKSGFFERFLLRIKNYYRRFVIGVKKGYSVNTVPPETDKLLSKPLIQIFSVLGVICMGLCLSKIISYINVYIHYTMVIIYSMFGFFLLYISILIIKYTNNLIQTGAFEVRNSPLYHNNYRIAKFIGISRALVGFGTSAATTLSSIYSIDCVLKEMDKGKVTVVIVKIIKKFIIWFMIFIVVGIGFLWINTIYCEPSEGVEVSPLQMILNYEIILGISILFHMCLLIIIWLHKLYVSSVWSIISKLLSQETVKKYDKFKKMMEKIGQRYLILLIIINVVFIFFDLGVIIYANIELSNNIDDFIHVHLNMKNNIIMLLFVKSKFNVNKNKIEKNKYFNAWSKVESKKRNNQMDGIDSDKLNLLILESKGKDVGNITGVENVTINNSISSDKNIITISTEEIEEKIMNLPSLSENLINKKIVRWNLDSKESIDRELYLKKVDEEFKNIVIYLKISSSYPYKDKLL